MYLDESQLKALIAEAYSRGVEDGSNADTNAVLKWAEEKVHALSKKNSRL